MIHIPNKPLAEAMSIITPAAKGSSISPLHVKAAGDGVLFRLYGQYGIAHKVKADVEAPLEFYVNVHTFGDVVRALGKAGELTALSLADDNRLELSCGTFKPRLSLLSDEYGAANQLVGMPELGALESHTTLPDDAVLAAMNDVLYASSAQEYQAVFRGVLLDPQADGVRVVATDGFRMAYKELALDTTFPYKAILSRALVPAVAKTFADATSINVTFVSSGGDVGVLDVTPTLKRPSQVVFATDKTLLMVELMEGSFPDYERVIPADFVSEFDVAADDFADVTKRVLLLSDTHANNRVDLGLLEGGNLTLTAESSSGEASDEAAVDGMSGNAGAWAFNGSYLTDALQQFRGQNVRVKFSGATSPALFQPEGEQSLAMVVPLRTS
jgi:DNA polymerase-3 subunit beta